MPELNSLSKTWTCPDFNKVLHTSRSRSRRGKSTDYYNIPKSEDSRSPETPKKKEDAIIDAFKHFQMI